MTDGLKLVIGSCRLALSSPARSGVFAYRTPSGGFDGSSPFRDCNRRPASGHATCVPRGRGRIAVTLRNWRVAEGLRLWFYVAAWAYHPKPKGFGYVKQITTGAERI